MTLSALNLHAQKHARDFARKLDARTVYLLTTGARAYFARAGFADCARTDAPAGVRFLSVEPLIGPMGKLELSGIDWVIVGGESGPGARPVNPDWVREIRDRCQVHGVAFFFKQWGGLRPKSGGRELDGREWNEFPKPAPPYAIAAE